MVGRNLTQLCYIAKQGQAEISCIPDSSAAKVLDFIHFFPDDLDPPFSYFASTYKFWATGL